MGVMMLNMDSNCSESNDIGAGGIIRDSKGQWVAGLSSNDDKGDALFAELFGVYHGLALIVNNSISNVVCETDDEEVVQLLRSRD